MGESNSRHREKQLGRARLCKKKRKVEEGIASPILLWMNFIRRFATANRKRKGGGLTIGGERWRQTRGMTCLHKKGKEIRNLNYCGMRMALWHQFSWQPENSAACMPAQCANASGLRMKEREERKMKVGEKKLSQFNNVQGRGINTRGKIWRNKE